MGVSLRQKLKKAIFFDRDGIINKVILKKNKPHPPSKISEFELVDGIKNLLEFTKQNGFLNIIVTNQPDAQRGSIKKSDIEEINNFILKSLPIDKIYVCWDAHDNMSNLRKPLPGMLLQAKEDFFIDLKLSYMIGDRWKDINAGFSVGCKTIFMNYNYDEKLRNKPDFIIDDLKTIKSIVINN
tara:strand:+ start:4317 stop:4865 length:549 start_codon:yes stop_codon:yes gene_type:complete